MTDDAHQLTVEPDEQGLRLDQFLVKRLPSTLSRTVIQRAIEHDHATVDGQPAKSNRRLKTGQRVTIQLADTSPPDPNAALPEQIPLDIIHEDADVLVLNKPPGLVTHPAPGNWTGTLVNAVAWHLQQNQGDASKLPRAGIVHRLDKDTSGLLIVAKNETALRLLARQLKDRTIARTYLALVEGDMEFNEGTVDAPIGRNQWHREEMAVRRLGGGREAVTRYRVIARVKGKPAYTALEVNLETGRTHQIRVHMAHLGHPVLGDLVYSRHPAGFWSALGITRQLLHAVAIRFVHPMTGKPLAFSAGIPDDLATWLPADARARLDKLLATD